MPRMTLDQVFSDDERCPNPILNQPYYLNSYHIACNYLVHQGAHGRNRQAGRNMIAHALRELRRQHGHKQAHHERRHMLFISGMFPEKESQS